MDNSSVQKKSRAGGYYFTEIGLCVEGCSKWTFVIVENDDLKFIKKIDSIS